MAAEVARPGEDSAQAFATRSLTPLAIALCIAGLAAAALTWSGVEVAGLARGLLALVFASAALPWCVRATAGAGSAWKLALITCSLSPALFALLYASLRALSFLDARTALAVAAAIVGIAQLFAIGARVRRFRFDPTAAACAVAGLIAAGGAGALLLRGSAARLSEVDVARAALALGIDRAFPPAHPWLALEPYDRAFSAEVLLSVASRAFDVAPTLAAAVLVVAFSALLPSLLSLWASNLCARARSLAIAVALALFGAGWPAPAAWTEFQRCGPAAWACAWSLVALACAGHALRHARRPWIELCGAAHGLALLAHFDGAWPAALATTLCAFLPGVSSAARPRLLLAMILGAVPALVQARLQGPATPAEYATDLAGRPLLALGALASLAAIALALRWRHLAGDRRAVALHAIVVAVLGPSCAILWPARVDASVVHSLSAAALAITAAMLWDDVAPAGGRRVFGAVVRVLTLAMVALGAHATWRGTSGARELAARDEPHLVESGRALLPRGDDVPSGEARAALEFLQDQAWLARDRAVLLACPIHNPYRKTRDLPERALAACAGIDLYGDTRSALTAGNAAHQPRLEELLRLFRRDDALDPTLLRRIEAAGARSAVVWMRDEDRALLPSLPVQLQQMGFLPWREFGGSRLFLGPRARALEMGAADPRTPTSGEAR